MNTPFSAPINQLGCVVSNLDGAIDGWLQLGVGPFLTLKDVGISDYVYKGKPSKPKLDVAFSQNGSLQIELIHPANDELSIYKDFLAAGREGIHHVCWFIEDYDRVVSAIETEGRPVLQKGEWAGMRFVYLEPAAGNGVITELCELTPVSRQVFALVRKEAANWDGKDPVRSLVGEAGWGLRWDVVKAELSHLLRHLERPT